MPLGGSPVGAAGISAGGSSATLVPPVGEAVANGTGACAGNSPLHLAGGVEVPGTYPTGLVGGLSTDGTSSCPSIAGSPLFPDAYL